LGGEDPSRVSLLPLPLSINELFARFQGTPLLPARDERFHRWTGATWADEETTEPPFTPEQLERFEKERLRYIEGFRKSLAAHWKLHVDSSIPSSDGRWASVASSGLDVEGIER